MKNNQNLQNWNQIITVSAHLFAAKLLESAVEVEVQTSKCNHSNRNRNWQHFPNGFISQKFCFPGLSNICCISIFGHRRCVVPEPSFWGTTNWAEVFIRKFLEWGFIIVDIPAVAANVSLFRSSSHGKFGCGWRGAMTWKQQLKGGWERVRWLQR